MEPDTGTMNGLYEASIGCPYCGEAGIVMVDESAGEQACIEDCHVCCRPILIQVRFSMGGDVSVEAKREDDT